MHTVDNIVKMVFGQSDSDEKMERKTYTIEFAILILSDRIHNPNIKSVLSLLTSRYLNL